MFVLFFLCVVVEDGICSYIFIVRVWSEGMMMIMLVIKAHLNQPLSGLVCWNSEMCVFVCAWEWEWRFFVHGKRSVIFYFVIPLGLCGLSERRRLRCVWGEVVRLG